MLVTPVQEIASDKRSLEGCKAQIKRCCQIKGLTREEYFLRLAGKKKIIKKLCN